VNFVRYSWGCGSRLRRQATVCRALHGRPGARRVARAGYDPRALARMFETIEREAGIGGGGGPQWMSSHPNPGNRTQYINQEAAILTIGSAADVSEFESIKAAFASLPPAGSMSDVEREKPEPPPD
jgi:predicted Zn-dependent protease